ncbi:MAG: hypothetical protein HDR02_14860 [Lachnospiraceae bacterium]|nr:hypothetical protein [Lachnospiraceae bacterium]
MSDAGLYIERLNGFPRPFLKQMNQWFGPEETLCLLQEKEIRIAEVSELTGTTLVKIFIPEG